MFTSKVHWKAAGALTAVLLAAPLAAVPAQATPWSPNVLLQGRATCGGNTPNSIYVQGSNGEGGWASTAPSTMYQTSYAFQFRRVPTSGINVTVTLDCVVHGKRSTTFGVRRPAVGTRATRNISFGLF